MNSVLFLRNVEKEKSSNRWKVEMRRPWNLKRHIAHCSKRWTSRPKNSKRYKRNKDRQRCLEMGKGRSLLFGGSPSSASLLGSSSSPSFRQWRQRSMTSRKSTSRSVRSWSKLRMSSPGSWNSSKCWAFHCTPSHLGSCCLLSRTHFSGSRALAHFSPVHPLPLSVFCLFLRKSFSVSGSHLLTEWLYQMIAKFPSTLRSWSF